MRAWVVAWLLAVAGVVSAQTVTNPTAVEYVASTDHDAIHDDARYPTLIGLPKVARYELRIYLVGTASPLTTADLGKATPDALRVIRQSLVDLLVGFPSGPQQYEVRVVAVGPPACFDVLAPTPCAGVSDPSNPFVVNRTIPVPAMPTGVRVFVLGPS